MLGNGVVLFHNPILALWLLGPRRREIMSMFAFRVTALAVLSLFFVYGSDLYAAEVSPFSGTQVMAPSEGYTLKIGDRVFSLAEVQGMQTYQSTFKTAFNLEGTFVGVKLLDVLQQAGIGDFKRLFVRAANDYKVTVSPSDPGIDQALLVYSLNGKLLPLNDKGPYWLIWPHNAEAVLAGDAETTKWSWSVVEIQKIF